jgi:thioredoxin reductase
VLDVVIIGGGPAGLSAALWLGRCGRRTRLFDDDRPRNAASQGLHGFLTRDGTPPRELRTLARTELAAYPTVEVRATTVTAVRREEGAFVVTARDGTTTLARVVLLATGRVDRVPDVPGFRALLGRGVYHCPYCDAWEHRGQRVAVYGEEEAAFGLADTLRGWTDDLLICPAGPRTRATWAPWRVASGNIVRLVASTEGRLQRLLFDDGASVACDALFFCAECRQRSPLPEALGCAFDDEGAVRCEGLAATNVPGLFVAGNVRGGVHLAIVAAAEGAEAAIAINRFLLGQNPG